MTTAAWIFMLSAWSVIIGVTAYCFFRLLTSDRHLGPDEPPAEEPPAPMEGS